MIDRLSPPARRIALALLLVAVVWFAWRVSVALNPLILGYLAAFIVHPLVLRLERRGWKRRAAVNLIFGGIALTMLLVGFGVFIQGRGLARELLSEDGLGLKVRMRVDQALEDHKEEISWLLKLIPAEDQRELVEVLQTDLSQDPGAAIGPQPVASGTELHSEDLTRIVADWWNSWLTEERAAQAGEVGLRAAGGVVYFMRRVFGSLLGFMALLVLLPIYTYFLLFELERIHAFVQRYLPRRDRARITKIGVQIGEVLASFFRGRLLVCVAKGSFLALGLAIAGVDYALLLGLGTGFLSLIPFVGSMIGFTMALLVALIEHSVGGAVVRTGIVFLAAEGLENYFLIPKIMGDSLGLHAIVVIFAIMAGGAALGMFGLLIALPLTASLVILAREFLLPVLADLADRDEHSTIIK